MMLLFSAALLGQPVDPVADSLQLDEVVVTHSKLPITLRNTIKPVEVITQEEIAASATTDLAQFLQEHSGIMVNGAYSNPAKDKALYVQGATGAYTLILIDGQPVADPSGIGGALDIRLLDLRQVERIEILKGSQSALYGTDAIAGVINIVTRSHKDGQRAAGRLSYGAYHTLEGDVKASRSLGNSDIGLVVGFKRSDGISEASADIPPADRDGMHTINLQSHFGTQLTDSLRVQAQFRFTRFEGDYDDGAFADADNTFSYQMYDPELRLELRKQRLQLDLAYDATITDRIFESSFGTDQYYGRFHNVEAFAGYRLSPYFRAAAGFSYQSHRMLDGAAAVADPQADIVSPFGSVVWENPHLLLIEASYRYSNHDAYGAHSTYSISAGRWLGSHVKLYASHATGFRAPTLSMLYGRFGPNPDLEPETSVTSEGGLEYWSNDDNLHARVNVFRRNIDDVITYTTGFVNQNAQSDKGLEVQCHWQPTNVIGVTGRYGFLEGTLTSIDDNGAEVKTSGLLRQPKHRFSLSAKLKIRQRAFVTVHLEHLGKRRDLFFNPEIFSTEEVSLEAYTIINVSGEYRFGEERDAVFLRVVNLTDTVFTEVYGFNTQGLSVYAGAHFTIGK